MDPYRAETTVSETGALHLDGVPFRPGERVQVVVCVAGAAKWPPGYFEATFGSIEDEGFVRHPQGSYEVRESFS